MKHFGYSFGVEEEFFLASASSGALVTRVPERLLEQARAHVGEIVTSELLQSQIEIASPVLHHCDEAQEVMSRARQALAAVVESMSLHIIAAGTHPLGFWQDQFVTEQPRYDELISDFRIIGHRNLVCGLHVHVAIPLGVDRVDVMNRAMRWLPLFLALSTSSPFWNCRATGLLSYRQALYDEWPRSGIPDFFVDEADYQAFAARMQRAGAVRDSSQLWWAVRPAMRYPTLELRIADTCTRLEDAIAIASLFRCLVATIVGEPALGRERSTHTRRIIDENRWRAKRDGTGAVFIDEHSNELAPVREVLRSLVELAAEHIERLDCARSLQPLQRVLDEGTSAHVQLRLYNEGRAAGESRVQALRRALDWLERTTRGEEPVAPVVGGTDCRSGA